MRKKLLIYALVLALFLPSLAGCQPSDPSDNTGGSSTSGEDDGLSGIPEANFGGESVVIYAWDNARMPEFAVELDGNDTPTETALVRCHNMIENRLSVKLDYRYSPKGNDVDSYRKEVEIVARANSGDFDILASYSRSVAQCALAGYARDLTDFDVIDLGAPWWSQSLISTSKINDSLYYASGDISTNLLYMMNCVFFNTKTLAAYDLESPYDLVHSNRWTQDKMFEMASGLYRDINENLVRDFNDEFGLVCTRNNYDAFFYGAGLTVIENDNGMLRIGENYRGEKCYDWIRQMIENFITGKDCYQETGVDEPRDCFGAGRSLFLVDSPFCVDTNLNHFEDCEYGIVPVPKWDVYQEKYCTGMRYTYTLYSVFAGSKNATRAATVMEGLAAGNYHIVTPAVFEDTMKYQYSLDNQASQMFDIIRDNIVYDFGREFTDSFGVDTAQTYWGKISAGDTSWMSYIARLVPTMENNLKSILDGFKKSYGN